MFGQHHRWRAPGCALLSLLSFPALAGPQVETLGALSALGEPLITQAQDVAEDGAAVVGYSLFVDPVRDRARQAAFVWRKVGGMRPLPYLTGGGNTAAAQAISADGKVIVGMSDGRSPSGHFWSHATRWRAGEAPQDLGALPGGRESAASDVSGRGEQIVGYSHNRLDEPRAVLWQQDRPPQDLGTLGGQRAIANAISQTGSVIVGVAHNTAQQSQAFVWRPTSGMRALSALPGSASAMATAVSADGQTVAGCSAEQIDNWFNPLGVPLRGVIWHLASGRSQEIINTLGGDSTLPLGIANDGLSVVGVAKDAHGEPHAFRWTPSGGMTAETTLPPAQRMRYVKGLSGDGRFSAGALTESDDAFLADWRTEIRQ